MTLKTMTFRYPWRRISILGHAVIDWKGVVLLQKNVTGRSQCRPAELEFINSGQCVASLPQLKRVLRFLTRGPGLKLFDCSAISFLSASYLMFILLHTVVGKCTRLSRWTGFSLYWILFYTSPSVQQPTDPFFGVFHPAWRMYQGNDPWLMEAHAYRHLVSPQVVLLPQVNTAIPPVLPW